MHDQVVHPMEKALTVKSSPRVESNRRFPIFKSFACAVRAPRSILARLVLLARRAIVAVVAILFEKCARGLAIGTCLCSDEGSLARKRCLFMLGLFLVILTRPLHA